MKRSPVYNSYPFSYSETGRLEAVSQFGSLNFDDNKELDDLVLLAIQMCNVPMALITLMGEDLQWTKCASGIKMETMSREDSFCKYLVARNSVMVVHDTLHDERFINNVAVTGEHAIRFYAGAPLITSNGYYLGSLCVLDRKPRKFSKKQTEMLAILSRQVIHMLELQMSMKQIAVQNAELSLQKGKMSDQNKSLLEIAYIQSHEYRRPVASIMGLMNIIKGYNYRASKKCLMMMEAAVNELDEKIRIVVNCTHMATSNFN